MTRKELIEKVHQGFPEGELTPRQIAAVIDRVFGAIATSIRDEGGYTHPGFGTFKVKVTGARLGLNPRTGESIAIGAGATVAFKPSGELKESLRP